MERRWLTEFTGIDGERYAGPIILADGQPCAEAYLSVLQGPNGQALRLLGELVQQFPQADGDTQSHIRRV